MASSRRLLRMVAAISAAALLVAPVAAAAPSKRSTAKPVQPAPTEPPAEMPAAVDPALAAAQELYSRGLTHYETLDYDLAIESWKEALEKLRAAEVDTADKAQAVGSARTAIVYNIARAQQRAFEQDHDVARLKKAKGLLELYMRDSTESGNVDEAELELARARIQEISDQIAEAEKPAPVLERPPPPPEKPRGRGLIAGGAVATVVGVGAVVGGAVVGTRMSGGAESKLADLDQLGDEAARREELARGRTGDTVLMACTVAGGVVAVAGIVMLAVGVKRSKASRPAPVAGFGRGVVTLGIAGRF